MTQHTAVRLTAGSVNDGMRIRSFSDMVQCQLYFWSRTMMFGYIILLFQVSLVAVQCYKMFYASIPGIMYRVLLIRSQYFRQWLVWHSPHIHKLCV